MKQEDPWRSRRSAKKVQRVRPEHFPAAKGNGGRGGRLAFHPSPSSKEAKEKQASQPSPAKQVSTAPPSPAGCTSGGQAKPGRALRGRGRRSRAHPGGSTCDPLPPVSPAVAVAGLAVTGGWTLTHGWPDGRCYNGREGKTALGRKCTNQPPRAGSRAADDVTEGCL